MLETLSNEANAARMIHMLLPTNEKNQFRLGRGHEADLRVTDISVSRLHAVLSCKSNGYYIEDSTSKFGTLALTTQAELDPTTVMALQIGRTVIRCEVTKRGLDK